MNDEIETRKFPGEGGSDVHIVRKKDILKTIDLNITDKDIALELISKLEKDAAEYMTKGIWISIPFIGNIKIKDSLAAYNENSELFKEAKDTMTKEEYVLFRKNVIVNACKEKRESRLEDYNLSKLIKRNSKSFNKLIKKHGAVYSKLHFRLLQHYEIVKLEDNG